MIEIFIATETDRTLWDAYLLSQAASHHAFCWEWRSVIGQTFGHTPRYLIARDMAANGTSAPAIVGILPLFHVKSVLFGSALISLPYLNAGGVLADSQQAYAALLDKARALGADLNADYLELRCQRECPWDDSLEVRTHKVAMVLELEESAEAVFAGFKPKLRSQVRRPSKSGLYAHVTSGEAADGEALDAFYSVFSEHMRDLGTPVFPRALFSNTVRSFGERCRVIVVWHGENAVAAGITIRHERSVEIPWASALRKHSREAPNMLLYWEAIKAACEDGAAVFDFGRSSYGSGPHRFKQQWGASPVPLHWYYDLRKGKMPDINPANPKYAAMVGCWQRLPLPVANTLGPWITRSLP